MMPPAYLGQTLGELLGEVEEPPQGQRAIGEQLTQGRAVDKLHGDVRDPVLVADIVDVDDVRVGQGRSCARLLLESPHAVGIVGQERMQHLDGHIARQPVVARTVHFTDATRPQALDQPETTQHAAQKMLRHESSVAFPTRREEDYRATGSASASQISGPAVWVSGEMA